MITRGKRKAQAGSQCLSLRYITKGSDLIPTSPLLQLEAGRNFETFIVEYLRLRALFKHWQKYHNNSNKDKVGVTFTFHVKVKNPIDCPFSPPSPLSSSCWLFCPLGAQHKFALQGPPGYPLTHRGGAAELTTYKDQPSCWPQGRGTS